MLNNKISRCIPIVLICIRKLRFQGIFYFMLVVVFPLSYLVINMMGRSSQDLSVYAIGMYISMMFSLYINMQATLISGANRIEIMEYYSVFKINPLDEFLGESIFHAALSCILLLPISFAIIVCSNGSLNIRVIFWFVLCTFFMHQVSVFIGGLMSNPNIASPIINLIYMIIIMATPIYLLPSSFAESGFIGYAINPFSHVIWTLYYSFGYKAYFPEILSWVYPLIIASVLCVINNKRWRMASAIEKLTIY